MEKQKCKHYESCNAPLCPFDQESIEHGIWYPDEEICKKRINLKWVHKQRFLVKREANPELYFDVKLLNTPAVKGKDPDKGISRKRGKPEN